MTPDLEVLKKVKSAAIPLYNALSAEQKQTADSLNRISLHIVAICAVCRVGCGDAQQGGINPFHRYPGEMAGYPTWAGKTRGF